jgi:Uma2 family endonuclease
MNVQRKLMSADEFLEWRQGQPGRWELVGGMPILMMAGAKQRHDQIVVNVVAGLMTRLRGTRCRPWTADIATRIPNGNVRQPDVTVDCGPRRDDALDSTAPAVVFEVLSPSTKTFDQVRKLDEYKRVDTMRHIVLVDPARPRAVLWTRDGAGLWSDSDVDGLEDSLNLVAIAISLPLAEVCEDVAFDDDT